MGVSWSDSSSSNGEVITPALLNNIRTNINSYHTGGIPNADLAKPEHLVVFGPVTVASLGSGETKKFVMKTPVALIPASLQIYFESDDSGSPTLSVDIKEGSGSILSAAETTTTPDTLQERTSFADDSIAAGALITFVISETVGGVAGNVCVTLVCKAEHTT